jgi:electron transfer flavoprotein alpha subunit
MMKALIVSETREGNVLSSYAELVTFASAWNLTSDLFYIGNLAEPPSFDGTAYGVDLSVAGEYNPELHVDLIHQAVEKSGCDCVVLPHSSYGWDLAPRLALSLKKPQVSEVTAIVDGDLEVNCLNGKMKRTVSVDGGCVITVQAGAFACKEASSKPSVTALSSSTVSKSILEGYEAVQKTGVDLSRAEVIVTVGRGVGKKDNIPFLEGLAKALGGELGASRPVVDAGWLDHSHQVGTTGQSVSPRLYVACGVSGAIQHLAGMKKSEFVIAINKDREAPFADCADVLVVADVMQFIPAFIDALKK